MLKGISWEGKKRHFQNKEVPLIEKYFKIVKMVQGPNLLFFYLQIDKRVCSFLFSVFILLLI